MTEKIKNHEHHHNHIIGAVVLISAGVALLLKQANILSDNFSWWALFILIPGLALWWQAFNLYRKTRNINGQIMSFIVAGLISVLFGFGFLLNLSLGNSFWAILLIIGGGIILLRSKDRG